MRNNFTYIHFKSFTVSASLTSITNFALYLHQLVTHHQQTHSDKRIYFFTKPHPNLLLDNLSINLQMSRVSVPLSLLSVSVSLSLLPSRRLTLHPSLPLRTTSDKHFVLKTSPSSAQQPLQPHRNRTSLVWVLVIWSIQDARPAIPLSPIHLTPRSRLRRRADDGVNISPRLAGTLTTTMRRLAVKSG